ncbi:MAG: DUF1670 domain-containing protein [Thermodesulfovibrionales bacterium]
MSGSLIYKIEDGHRLLSLQLTVCDEDDLNHVSLSELRRKRIIRLLKEAKEQGYLLSYKDLNLILLSSLATLKRDISYLRKQGIEVFIKNGNGNGSNGK